MNPDIRLCFVGDSFVNGTGDESALGWVGRVCSSAHAQGIPVTYYNLGIRRDTSQDMLLRWATECRLRLPDSCDGRLVLSCGINDTTTENGSVRVPPAQSCANVYQILTDASLYRRLLVGPPPVGDAQHNARIQALSKAYSQLADKLGVPFIELFSPLLSDSSFMAEVTRNDGFHPHSQGYASIAKIVAASPLWWFRPS